MQATWQNGPDSGGQHSEGCQMVDMVDPLWSIAGASALVGKDDWFTLMSHEHPTING